MIFRRVFLIIIVLPIIFSVGCVRAMTFSNEEKEKTTFFIEALRDEDYSSAMSCVHPAALITEENIKESVQQMKSDGTLFDGEITYLQFYDGKIEEYKDGDGNEYKEKTCYTTVLCGNLSYDIVFIFLDYKNDYGIEVFQVRTVS